MSDDQEFELLLTVRLHGGGTAEDAARAFNDSAGLVLDDIEVTPGGREIEVLAAEAIWAGPRPAGPAPETANTEALLKEAANVLRDVSLRLIAVKPWLDKPYTDAPETTPWKRTIERRARLAHDLSVRIRRFLA